MGIKYIGAILIRATSPKELSDWYSRFLKFSVTLEHEGGFYGSFETERGPFHFGITPDHSGEGEGKREGVVITFRVDDLGTYIQRFKRQGIHPVAEVEDEEGRYVMYNDPEGNQISLWGD